MSVWLRTQILSPKSERNRSFSELIQNIILTDDHLLKFRLQYFKKKKNQLFFFLQWEKQVKHAQCQWCFKEKKMFLKQTKVLVAMDFTVFCF